MVLLALKREIRCSFGRSEVINDPDLLNTFSVVCGLEEPRFHENVLRAKQKNLLSNFDKARSIFKKSDKPEDKAVSSFWYNGLWFPLSIRL